MIHRCKHLRVEQFLQSHPPYGSVIEAPEYCTTRKCNCKFITDPESCLDYEEFWVRLYQRDRDIDG